MVETSTPANVQLTNVYPVLAIAVTVTSVTPSNEPDPLVDPPSIGLDDKFTANWFAGTIV